MEGTSSGGRRLLARRAASTPQGLRAISGIFLPTMATRHGTCSPAIFAHEAGGQGRRALQALGLGSVPQPREFGRPAIRCSTAGCANAPGFGKHPTSGHWELMGVVTEAPMPTYPNGFPPAVIEIVREASGRRALHRRPRLTESTRSRISAPSTRHPGGLIVYIEPGDRCSRSRPTSRRSSLRPCSEICATVRARAYCRYGGPAAGSLRPFAGPEGEFARTEGRRDFTSVGAAEHELSRSATGSRARLVLHLGRIGRCCSWSAGIDFQHPGATNARALEGTIGQRSLELTASGFTNVVET